MSEKDLEEIRAVFINEELALFEQTLESAVAARRPTLLARLIERLGPLISVQDKVSEDAGADWIAIESLSRLRSTVGGRFQNLKERWIDAGLPLRRHRGDRGKKYKVSEKGWFELANWISKQGYEARLTPETPDCFFEVRATESES